MKKISFSVDEDEYKKIKKAAEEEGLTPSQFVKRTTILAAKNKGFDGSMATYEITEEG
jgi:uncharacterized protein (DUF1778 family)